LLIALSTTSFQISKLSPQGKDVVPSEAEEELDPGHGSQLRSQTGRQPAQLKELDGCQHLNLTGERSLIHLFSQQYGFRYIDYELSTRHELPFRTRQTVSQAPQAPVRYTACDPDGKTS
jgi:hypothetical protein